MATGEQKGFHTANRDDPDDGNAIGSGRKHHGSSSLPCSPAPPPRKRANCFLSASASSCRRAGHSPSAEASPARGGSPMAALCTEERVVPVSASRKDWLKKNKLTRKRIKEWRDCGVVLDLSRARKVVLQALDKDNLREAVDLLHSWIDQCKDEEAGTSVQLLHVRVSPAPDHNRGADARAVMEFEPGTFLGSPRNKQNGPRTGGWGRWGANDGCASPRSRASAVEPVRSLVRYRPRDAPPSEPVEEYVALQEVKQGYLTKIAKEEVRRREREWERAGVVVFWHMDDNVMVQHRDQAHYARVWDQISAWDRDIGSLEVQIERRDARMPIVQAVAASLKVHVQAKHGSDSIVEVAGQAGALAQFMSQMSEFSLSLQPPALSFPSHWTSTQGLANRSVRWTTVELNRHGREWDEVLSTFGTGGASATWVSRVSSIARVQNPLLWAQHQSLIQHMGGDTRKLFHGTPPCNEHPICEVGFDRIYAGGAHGTAYGHGTYFATDLSYAVTMGQTLFLCSCVIGDAVVAGYAGLRNPSTIQPGCFTAVDHVHHPSMYILFRDFQAYPEYIIRF